MLTFDPSFFEDEVRCGFYIPSMTKRAWAVEMEVLSEVDRICQKYDITYYAGWGTFLGAVRHHGFIPWDDDMDIFMHRNDFEKFMSVAKDELPDEYYFSNFETSKNNWNFLVNITSHSRMCFEPEYLEAHHGFPYMAGLDIFFFDNIPDNPQQREDWLTVIRYIINVADLMEEGSLTGAELEHSLSQIENICNVTLSRDGNMYQRKVQLYQLAMRECARYNGHPTTEISQLMPLGLYHGWKFPANYCRKTVRIPFEHIDIPVPIDYEKLLELMYPDYMTIRMGYSGHDYPYYAAQKAALGTDLDFVPKYHFAKEDLQKDRTIAGNSLKTLTEMFIHELHEKSSLFDRSQPDFTRSLLIELQQQIIQLGTLIEQTKDNDQPVVKQMELCCESLYVFHEAFTKETQQALLADLSKLDQELRSDVLARREIVFLPFKACYWQRFEPEWQQAMNDPTCDVYVIPIPYYYKKYDGTLLDMHYETSDFPAEVTLTPYKTFDFSLHQPDEIYLQNPYDEYNMALTVHPSFYASRLKNYTDKLIYKPYFELNDFDADNNICTYNMQFYCTMPGVIQADQVKLSSSQMKQRYIEQLTAFAGDDTRDIWMQKITEASGN